MEIKRKVYDLVEKFQTRDPFKIAKFLKINIIYSELGETKGFFKKILRRKFIFINSNLRPFEKKVVCAHELAHAILHSNKELQFLLDNTNMLKKSNLEIEANTFAAELLIDDDFDNDEYIGNPSIDIRILEQLKELKYIKK